MGRAALRWLHAEVNRPTQAATADRARVSVGEAMNEPTTAALTDVQIARLLNEQSPDVDVMRQALEQALDQRDEARYALDRIGAEVRGVTKW